MNPETATQLSLCSPWTWWEHEHSGDYNSTQLGSCDNIATFWQYFNNIPQPETFFTTKAAKRKLVGRRKVDALSLFRQGVAPEWEDPQNSSGGEILFRSDKLELVNSMWYELALAVVGQTVRLDGGQVLGVRVLDKSSKGKIEYRVEVWYSEGVDAPVLIEQLRTMLASLHENLSFSVRNHSSTLQKTLDKSKPKGKGEKSHKGNQSNNRAVKLPAPAEATNMRMVHVG